MNLDEANRCGVMPGGSGRLADSSSRIVWIAPGVASGARLKYFVA